MCIGCAYRLPTDGFLAAVTVQAHALVHIVPCMHDLASSLGLGWPREANSGRQAPTLRPHHLLVPFGGGRYR
jgi:hypothetical protein